MKNFFKNSPHWIIILIVLVVGIFFFAFFPGQRTGDDVSEVGRDRIGEMAIAFISENLMGPEESIELVDVSEGSGTYILTIKVSHPGMEEGETFDIYATKDGKYLFPMSYSMNQESLFEEEPDHEEKPAAVPSNIENFIACLSGQNFKIYGAEWCPYCGDLVDKFGGYDLAEPIYVECTKEVEICEEKNIVAYPTILLGGEEYEGMRNLESFAEKTGCSLEY